MAGCGGPRRGQGMLAAGARPRGFGLLLGAAFIACLSPACTTAGWCSNGGLVQGLTVPARASLWVQGVHVCVSVRQCVTGACCGIDCQLLRDATGHSQLA